jgi:hypothetical protein
MAAHPRLRRLREAVSRNWPNVSRRGQLAVGLGLNILSLALLVLQAWGVSKVPLPGIAAICVAIGTLILLRVIWDYHTQNASLTDQLNDKIRRRLLKNRLGDALLALPKGYPPARWTARVMLLISAGLSKGDAAAFLHSGRKTEYLADLIERVDQLDVNPSFHVSQWDGQEVVDLAAADWDTALREASGQPES